ncbi:MAG: DDE-type integrase/transposase/recombinase [Pseudomonadales bacterium]|nr:DDE-type integrase/transposase/recombinase [Pseudomonadales bacterium]
MVNIHKSGANKAGIDDFNREYNCRIEIRQFKYLNNVIEQDHRFVKRKMKHALGYESFVTARKTISIIRFSPVGATEPNKAPIIENNIASPNLKLISGIG